MRIALCAPFMEADLLAKRIQEVVTEEDLIFDEYHNIDTLLSLPGLSLYDTVWVALPGAIGIEAIIRIREKDREISLIWLSDNEEFAAVGAGQRLDMFLLPGSSTEEFRIAVENSRRRRRFR